MTTPSATAAPTQAHPVPGHPPLRVSVLGKGAIGGPVVDALHAGQVPGAIFAGCVDTHGATDPDKSSITLDQLMARTDLVVEAAGHDVLADVGPTLIAAGVDVLAVSLGALADAEVHDALHAGPGRLFLSTGAVGGLDLIRAVAGSGCLRQVTLETTKLPTTVVQGWMDPEQRDALLAAPGRVEVLRGRPQEIATAFPRSANVAMAIATAAGDSDLVRAAIYADPDCQVTTHDITVESTTGDYHFRICSQPSSGNAATSIMVPHAVIRALRDLAGRPGMLI